MSGMTEIAAAKVAVAKSGNPGIKNFANKMIKDHSQADNEVKALAKKKDVTLPTALDKDHQDKLDDLNKASATNCDDEYSDMMSSAHDDHVDLFSDPANDRKDSDIKLCATATHTKLKVHKT